MLTIEAAMLIDARKIPFEWDFYIHIRHTVSAPLSDAFCNPGA